MLVMRESNDLDRGELRLDEKEKEIRLTTARNASTLSILRRVDRQLRSETVFILSCHCSYGPSSSLLLRLDLPCDNVRVM